MYQFVYYICPKCGVIGEIKVDHFSAEKNKSRCPLCKQHVETHFFSTRQHSYAGYFLLEKPLNEKYSSLKKVLDEAHDQAANGKGKERHGNDLAFEDQPILQIARTEGRAFLTGQAIKKIIESKTLLQLKGVEAAKRELLGAINYLAAEVIRMEEGQDSGK